MADILGPDEHSFQLKFGAGVHSRASEDEIDARECASGENFDLDLQNQEFRPRPAIELIGTVPNAAEIRGFVSLLQTDGTVSFLVQAGDTVYEWDGATTFTSKGTVSATAQLRGRLDHNWQLDDKVIITDLNLQETVMEWDGTTLQNISFVKADGSTSFPTFKAKYCSIRNERAIFANIDDGNPFPHLMVGSQRGDFTVISVANRPSSSLSEGDPYFLIQPDYHPINGLTNAFGRVVTSSEKGSMFNLTGTSAKDFAFDELFPRSGASGAEAVEYIGDDILYGRAGIIESLASTDRFGDVESDDASRDIKDLIQDFKDWTIVYNSRKQVAYCFPDGQSQVWVLYKSLRDSGTSPWSKWTTQLDMAFNPTAVMNALDPDDGLEYVFMGDDSGNLYRMEGTGNADGGSTNIRVQRLSKLFRIPLDKNAFKIQGWVLYRKDEESELNIQLEFSGNTIMNQAISMTLPSVTGRPVYGGSLYYSDGNYYGTTFRGRLERKKFGAAGSSGEIQVRATIEGQTDFQISEIGFRFKATS